MNLDLCAPPPITLWAGRGTLHPAKSTPAQLNAKNCDLRIIFLKDIWSGKIRDKYPSTDLIMVFEYYFNMLWYHLVPLNVIWGSFQIIWGQFGVIFRDFGDFNIFAISGNLRHRTPPCKALIASHKHLWTAKKLQKWAKDPKKGWQSARKLIPGHCGSISDRTQKAIFRDFGDFGDFWRFLTIFDNFWRFLQRSNEKRYGKWGCKGVYTNQGALQVFKLDFGKS